MLAFASILKDEGLDPKSVLVIRHAPREAELKRVLPWLAADRPDLFKAWQQVQWQPAEKAMTRAKWVAAFIGQEPGRATFAGLSRITGWRQLDRQGYLDFPGNPELIALGMTQRSVDDPAPLAFELEADSRFVGLAGKLVVAWPKPDQSWSRWAANSAFHIVALHEESRFDRGMPSWDRLVLTWAQLKALPSSWRSALSHWRGIYYIYDTFRRSGYVGSAGGNENILGRWQSYAVSGHGGNRQLRLSRPADLIFSILERTSPDLDVAELVAREASWKERLHSKQFGLNDN